jgi:hypothetical protein
LFGVMAQPPGDRAGEGDDPRAALEAVLGDFAEITDPVEAEVLGSIFLGALGLFGADVDAAAAAELVAVIEEVGDPQAAGMHAVLGALGEGPIGEAAAGGASGCGHAASRPPNGWRRCQLR